MLRSFFLASLATLAVSFFGCSSEKNDLAGEDSALQAGQTTQATGAGFDEDPDSYFPVQQKRKVVAKVYTSPVALFADMQREAYPISGAAGGIERAAASKWCDQNIPERRIRWSANVLNVSITGEDPFNVVVLLDSPTILPQELDYSSLASVGDGFLLGNQGCRAFVRADVRVDAEFGANYRSPYAGFAYSYCTAAEAKKLRALKGQEVVLVSSIDSCYVLDDRSSINFALVPFVTEIDGFLPTSMRQAFDFEEPGLGQGDPSIKQ